MTIRCAALTLFALSGCSAAAPTPDPQPPIDFGAEIQVSELFSTAERGEIDAAFADWDLATGGSARFRLVPSPWDAPWSLERAPLPTGLGLCDRAARAITIDGDAITPPGLPVFAAELRAVTLHELGHAMGLPDGGDGLMNQHVGDCIDRATLETLCALRPCAAMRPTCAPS